VVQEDVADFARSLRSIWALDLLMLLFREPERAWLTDDLARQLRIGEPFIRQNTAALERRQILVRERNAAIRYAPTDPAVDDLIRRLARIYAQRPLAVTREIYNNPNEKLRIFSDAFKIKKE
jgi:hypothetical protein